jgi:hypothetical protein
MGIVCNRDPNFDSWYTLAYPGRPPFNGDQQIFDGGKFNIKAFRQGSLTFRDMIIAMENSDMTQGASGGPWIVNYTGDPFPQGLPIRQRLPKGLIIHPAGYPAGPIRRNFINGVSSYINPSKPGFLYSPEFGRYFVRFFDEVVKTNPIPIISQPL